MDERMLQVIAAMNPELAPILALLQDTPAAAEKTKRKPSAYNRRYGAAYKRIKKKHTLKNGKMAKGWGGKKGHARIREAAHKEARKK